MSTFGSNPFTEMENSFFSFDAYTKLWIGLAQNIPAELSGNMKGIREFLMTAGNPACDEITFTGQITIYRGVPAKDKKAGAAYIPMSVVGVDEVGYAKSINTTIRVTADFSKPNFGYTHQMAAASLEIPAEARMLMTLRFSGIGGNLAEQLNISDATVAKQISATINSFPFTNGAAVTSACRRRSSSDSLKARRPDWIFGPRNNDTSVFNRGANSWGRQDGCEITARPNSDNSRDFVSRARFSL